MQPRPNPIAPSWAFVQLSDGYVHRAHLIGTIAEKAGIVPFMELVDKVMTQEPYASARTVYWVVDNGSSHNGKRSIDRMTAAWPNARLVHLPVHASWLDQIEIVFRSFSARSSSRLTSPTSPPWRIVSAASSTATTTQHDPSTPFDWRFTRSDLAEMLGRLDAHRLELETTLAA